MGRLSCVTRWILNVIPRSLLIREQRETLTIYVRDVTMEVMDWSDVMSQGVPRNECSLEKVE